MSNKTLGRFYFKCTKSGNLIGEFSNYQGDNICTESSDRRRLENEDLNRSNDNVFVGKFRSTWHDGDEPLLADLEIIPKATNSRLFNLTWKWAGGKRDGETAFVGQGMLCDDMLIGDYQGFPNE